MYRNIQFEGASEYPDNGNYRNEYFYSESLFSKIKHHYWEYVCEMRIEIVK